MQSSLDARILASREEKTPWISLEGSNILSLQGTRVTPRAPHLLAKPPQRILVIRLGAVGDLVRTLPAVDRLRQTWPEARIAWAVEKHTAPLILGHPVVDEWIILDRDKVKEDARGMRPAAMGRIMEFARAMREFRPDVAIDFQGCFKSGLAAALSRAPVRVGFRKEHVRESSHLFYNRRVSLEQRDEHRVLRALALVRAIGAEGSPARVDLALRPSEREQVGRTFEQLTGGRQTVALAPFSSHRQAWKRYPEERWSEIARELSGEGYCVLILAGPGEEAEARAIAEKGGPLVRVAEGVELRQLAALLERCSLLIGGDTGPMHIAWGVGTPVIALYGPTDPVLNAPFGEGHVSLHPDMRTGRSDEDRFPGITSSLVVSRARTLLDRYPREAVSTVS